MKYYFLLFLSVFLFRSKKAFQQLYIFALKEPQVPYRQAFFENELTILIDIICLQMLQHLFHFGTWGVVRHVDRCNKKFSLRFKELWN